MAARTKAETSRRRRRDRTQVEEAVEVRTRVTKVERSTNLKRVKGKGAEVEVAVVAEEEEMADTRAEEEQVLAETASTLNSEDHARALLGTSQEVTLAVKDIQSLTMFWSDVAIAVPPKGHAIPLMKLLERGAGGKRGRSLALPPTTSTVETCGKTSKT